MSVIRRSRVLAQLRAGQVALSFKLNLSDVRAAEIAAMAGFDTLWLDAEHVPNDWSAIEAQIYAAKAYDVDVMVRVARGSYSEYIKPLELDASGLMVPHVMNLDDARQVVRMTRFHPIGRRPVDGGNADGGYCQVDFVEYLRMANAERFLCLQIEDPEALADAPAIAALDGVDMLFFGPGDFSHGLGAPGQWDHPALTAARKQVAQICRDAGKFAGTVGSPASVPELVDLGYNFISVGADVVALGNYCRDMATTTRQAIADHK